MKRMHACMHKRFVPVDVQSVQTEDRRVSGCLCTGFIAAVLEGILPSLTRRLGG